MSITISIIVILGLIGIFIAVFLLVSKSKVQGKTLITIINKDKSINEYLVKLRHNRVKIGCKDGEDETYIIDTSRVMGRLYPSFGPRILRNTIPWLVYSRNNPDPLDPSNVTITPKGNTAKEITCMTNESVIEGLTMAARSETKKKDKIMLIAIGVIGIITIAVGIMVFLLMRDVNSLKVIIGG